MGRCGNPRIDGLMAGDRSAAPLLPGDADSAAVGLAQELLRGHGNPALPDLRGSGYGRFGDRTREAVLAFRARHGLGDSPAIDQALLKSLVETPATDPNAGRAYLTLVLDFEYEPGLALVSLTSLFESAGRFGCLNRNTDGAGLSFGIIQWAQKSGRLHRLLAAFDALAPGVFRGIVGGSAPAAGLLAHTARPNGGVNVRTGATTDLAFDLVAPPWTERFGRMGLAPELQKVQVHCAVEAFEKSLAKLRVQAPAIQSQRGLAFLADLANQHGDSGATAVYKAVFRPGMSEARLLEAMERESVRRLAAQYGAGSPEANATAARRAFFRTTPWLSGEPT